MKDGPRFDVVISDGTRVDASNRNVDAYRRHRLADFAFRHGFTYAESATPARPERRTYR